MFLLVLVIHEKFCSFSEIIENFFLKQLTFNIVIFQVSFKDFTHILSYYFYCILGFQEHLFFRTPFSGFFCRTDFLYFTVLGLGITGKLTRWGPVVLMLVFTLLGCLRLPEFSKKVCGMTLLGWSKVLDPALCKGFVLDLVPEVMLVFLFYETFK